MKFAKDLLFFTELAPYRFTEYQGHQAEVFRESHSAGWEFGVVDAAWRCVTSAGNMGK